MLTVVLISVALVIFFAGNAMRVVKTLRMPPTFGGNFIPSPKDRASANATAAPTSRSRIGGQSRLKPAAEARWRSL